MSPIQIVLNSLKTYLPRIAEEGNYVLSTPLQVLAEKLSKETELENGYVCGVLDLLEQHWVGQGFLDREQAKQGSWRFYSFSASLAARSMLEVWSWDRPQFVTGDKWLDLRHIESNREELRAMEIARATYSNLDQPLPIREVQVAWGLIKLDGKLLFNHRADRHRPEEANYVPIGGRLNLEDLERTFPESETEERLEWQQTSNLSKVNQAMDFTLKRELFEELQLIFPTHYQFQKAFELAPYEKLEGARANYVYTRYHIVCYAVLLTEAGFRKMCLETHDSENKLSEFLWANHKQLSVGKQGDRRLFLDAWRKTESQQFNEQFWKIPESFVSQENYAGQIDLPCEDQRKLKFGPTGKEQEATLELSSLQISLLQALGWYRIHGRDHRFEPLDGISLHPQGWVQLNNNYAELRRELNLLAEQLQQVGLPILEGDNSGWFRISVSLGNLYFSEQFFEIATYHPEPKSFELHLHVGELETPLGRIPKSVLVIDKLTQLIYEEITRILNVKPTESNADLVALFKQYLTRKSRPLGLRIPIRHEKGEFYTNCNPRLKS